MVWSNDNSKRGCSNAPLRTHELSAAMSYEEYHIEFTPLLEVGVDLILGFPYDYMHLICIGAVKKLLGWFPSGKRKVRRRLISVEDASKINKKLKKINAFWPTAFNRKPGTLDFLCWWTATQLRQFVLYLLPVVFRGSVLAPQYMELALLLHVAVTMLCRKDLVELYCGVAGDALRLFVKKSKSLLSKRFVTHNIHALIHIADDCARFGPLDNFSSFPFEHELGVLKQSISGKSKPLHQMVNRVNERTIAFGPVSRKNILKDGVIPKCIHDKGPRLQSSGTYYSKISWKGRIVSLRKGDNALLLHNGSVVLAQNFFCNSEGVTFVLGKRFLEHSDLYTTPIVSSDLGIFQVSKLSERLRPYAINDVKCKVVIAPLKARGSYAMFPFHN